MFFIQNITVESFCYILLNSVISAVLAGSAVFLFIVI